MNQHLTDTQWTALELVEAWKDWRTRTIGARPLTYPTARVLERKGLILVLPHPETGWAAEHAELTQRGRDLLEERRRIKAAMSGGRP